MRDYAISQLPIVMTPMIFTLMALLGLTVLPDRYLLTPAYPALYWSAFAGLAWTGIAWAVWQARVSRWKRGGRA